MNLYFGLVTLHYRINHILSYMVSIFPSIYLCIVCTEPNINFMYNDSQVQYNKIEVYSKYVLKQTDVDIEHTIII